MNRVAVLPHRTHNTLSGLAAKGKERTLILPQLVQRYSYCIDDLPYLLYHTMSPPWAFSACKHPGFFGIPAAIINLRLSVLVMVCACEQTPFVELRRANASRGCALGARLASRAGCWGYRTRSTVLVIVAYTDHVSLCTIGGLQCTVLCVIPRPWQLSASLL